MAIDDIYFRHYGGMPSALEARELTERSAEDRKLKRMEEIANTIRQAAQEGLSDVGFYIQPTKSEVKMLESLGYKVQHIPQEEVHVVSWGALEGNSTHPPSNPPEDIL